MPELPSGTVTFLYTDIEKSTRLWEQHEQLMEDALARHDQIWGDAVTFQQGQIYRVTGDGFCASFREAHRAVAAAAQAQQALYAEDWGAIGRLKSRAILHTGAAQVRDGDYVGASLNIAGRLLAVCHGGQILLSGTTADILSNQLPPGLELFDLGRHRFRDIAQAVRVYQLTGEGLPSEFPPLSSSATIPHNLPQQLTSFIGREKEIEALGSLLQQARLVTLVGPGGTGKTRLSLEVAGAALQNFADGVWLIQLAAISDPTLVNQSIAAVLGIREQPGKPFIQSLATYLRRKVSLLILDNCEHLVESCARTAAALLQDCPQLHILASSREGLGVAGERIYPLHPLSLPQESQSIEALAGNEAVLLFMERAALVNPNFSLSTSNAGHIVQICRRLDGIPLALELAAARTRQLTPGQIAARLDQSFRLLTGGSRTVLPRQQTLRALIDWSYDLLSQEERILFRRLAVFHGGWSLEAAEAVCARGEDPSTELDPFEIIDLSGQLVEKSIVEADLQRDEPRYRLLETMRQYGLEKLRDAQETAAVREQHLAYYSKMVLQSERVVFFLEELVAIERLDGDYDNILAALDWASQTDVPLFLTMTAALGPFWVASGYAAEGRKWLAQALAQAGEALSPEERMGLRSRIAQAHLFDGYLAFIQGQSSTALQILEASLGEMSPTADPILSIYTMGLISPVLLSLRRIEEAQAMAQKAHTAALESGDDMLIARTLSAMGGILLLVDFDAQEGWQLLEESVRRARKAGNDNFQSLPLRVLTEAAVAAGDTQMAWSKLQEWRELYQAYPDHMIHEQIDFKEADVYRINGDHAQAIAIYRRAVTSHRAFGNLGAMARVIECLAFIDIERGRSLEGSEKEQAVQRAARLLGAAQAIRANADATMFPHEQTEYQQEVAALEGLMDEEAFAAAWAWGQALSLDEAEDFARAETAAL